MNEQTFYDDVGAKRLASAIIRRAILDWCSATRLSTIGRFGHKETKKDKPTREDLCKISVELGYQNPVMELRSFFLSDWFRFLAESLDVDADAALVALGVKQDAHK